MVASKVLRWLIPAIALLAGVLGPASSAQAASDTLSITVPATATAGAPFSVTVTALDASNATATGYLGTIHFTSSDHAAGVALPADYTFVAGDNGVHTFTNGATLVTTGNQTITATDTTTASITGTSNNIAVSLPPATHLSVSAPSTVSTGSAFSVTVTALDASSNIATGYTGTVHFTSTDLAAGVALPADYTFTAGDAGRHTFTATLKTPGTQSISATDTATSSITGTVAISVVGLATHFAISAPTSTTAGNGVSFSITALDAGNRTAIGYTGTVRFSSTDFAAVLPANYTFTAGDAGAHMFTATLKTAGNQTITATDTATNSITATSNTIAVAPGSAVAFSVSTPSSSPPNAHLSFSVKAIDAFGNTATGYAGTVHFSSTDSAATLPANSTLTGGTGTFTATLRTTGTQRITATDTATSSIAGTSGATSVQIGAGSHLVVSAPSSATSGTAFTFTVTAVDTGGNTATGDTDTIHLTSSDPSAVLPANAPLVHGVATFTATLKSPGNQTITATDIFTPTINGTSGTIAITARPSPPTVHIVSPANGAMFALGAVVRASYTCADGAGGPGIKSCTGSVASGAPLDTTTAGPHTLTVIAVSQDGQSAQATASYTVVTNKVKVSGATASGGMVSLTIAVPGAGALTFVETADGKVIAGRKLTAHGATSFNVTLNLNQRGRRLLARHRRHGLSATVAITFTPAGGTARTVDVHALHLT